MLRTTTTTVARSTAQTCDHPHCVAGSHARTACSMWSWHGAVLGMYREYVSGQYCVGDGVVPQQHACMRVHGAAQLAVRCCADGCDEQPRCAVRVALCLLRCMLRSSALYAPHRHTDPLLLLGVSAAVSSPSSWASIRCRRRRARLASAGTRAARTKQQRQQVGEQESTEALEVSAHAAGGSKEGARRLRLLAYARFHLRASSQQLV